MKFEINQVVHLISSSNGHITVEAMRISKIEYVHMFKSIMYSGTWLDDEESGLMEHEEFLFSTREQALDEIERQLEELRGTQCR